MDSISLFEVSLPVTDKQFNVRTPKRRAIPASTAEESYPYYAGYAEQFAREALESLSRPGAFVFDPWNGAGTTTFCAASLGLRSFGTDLNPVMVVVAKARCASSADAAKARAKVELCISTATLVADEGDPLLPWIGPEGTAFVRSLANFSLSNRAGSKAAETLPSLRSRVSKAPRWSCLLLLAIFRAVKSGAAVVTSSNPTWTKAPTEPSSWATARDWWNKIAVELTALESINNERATRYGIPLGPSEVRCASSESIPLEDSMVDVVLTSPPYCTRIDYAVATLVELAVLGLSSEVVNSTLRKELLGTTSIRGSAPERVSGWGKTCNELLDNIFEHPSSGSRSYYYKNFAQYFDSLYRSMRELGRIVKSDGVVCVVLQGSHYKELPIDLPAIFVEMAKNNKLKLTDALSFDVTQHFGNINQSSRKYRTQSRVTEQVLVFRRGR
ncbi:hypothetical protein [Pandoraea sputorum]|uniref:hypothetical protein n=1 Tax=Pandoraea sputorum TaxID=93222 RepID=UPI002AF6CAEB|nr:hypothetical protein [Pandoraea sputorum]